MKFIVSDTINFLSKTFPKIYSSFYLEYLKQYASTYSVNKTQLRALITLKNNGAISMTALCNKLNIEKGSLTSMVDDLTKKGYVTRERDISDRRKYLITITERGEGIASDFVDKLKLSLEERLIKLTEEDKKILAEGKVDYIGFSYYMSFATKYQGRNEKTFDYVPEDFVRNTYLKASDWGWQIDPLGLRWCLNWFNDRFELPMMIVENGFGAYDKKEADGTVDDQYRIDYLKEHIQAMKDAVEYDGVDLLGYTMWSPIDIVSASTGEYDKRYGFIYVNYNNNHEGDFSRSKKKSFDWYKHVIETNGEKL